MRQRRATTALLTFALSVLVLMTGGCGEEETANKVPITTSSETAREYYLQGRDLAERLRINEAREYFQRAVEEDSMFAIAYLELAEVQSSVKDFFEYFNRARSLVDKVSEGEKLIILGFEAGRINGDPMRARRYFQQLTRMYGDDERARSLLASSYFGQQQWNEAVAEYQRAIKINPNFSQPYNQLGYAYRALGQYDKAEDAFKKYVELIPNDPNPYDSYAELLMKMGRFDESIEKYREALKVDPNFNFSRIGIAWDLCFKGDYKAAREELQEMYDSAADDRERRVALGVIATTYVDEGNYPKALELIQQRVTIAQQADDTAAIAGDLGLLATLLIESGRPEDAMASFEEAERLVETSSFSEGAKDQSRIGLFFGRCCAYVEMGKLDKAREQYEEYRARAEATQNPNQIKVGHQLAARIALKEDDFDTAIAELNQASQQNPYNLYRLGEAYLGKGDTAQAKEYFEKAANYYANNALPYAIIRKRAAAAAKSL